MDANPWSAPTGTWRADATRSREERPDEQLEAERLGKFEITVVHQPRGERSTVIGQDPRNHGGGIKLVPAGEVDLDGAEHVQQRKVGVGPRQVGQREREAAAGERREDRPQLRVRGRLVGDSQHHAVGPNGRNPEGHEQIAGHWEMGDIRAHQLVEAHGADHIAEQPRGGSSTGRNGVPALERGVGNAVADDSHRRVDNRLT